MRKKNHEMYIKYKYEICAKEPAKNAQKKRQAAEERNRHAVCAS